MRLLDGITDSMDMSLRKLRETVKYKKPGVLQPMGVANSQTRLSDSTRTRGQKNVVLPLARSTGQPCNSHSESFSLLSSFHPSSWFLCIVF